MYLYLLIYHKVEGGSMAGTFLGRNAQYALSSASGISWWTRWGCC